MNNKICFTIDTEYSSNSNRMGADGELIDKNYGVPFIIKSLGEYGFSGIFFIDVYNRNREDELKQIIEMITSEGHEIGLHTHPESMGNKYHSLLHTYDKDEQLKLIEYGKKLLLDKYNIQINSHRAGDWGANKNTMLALSDAKIKYDSSFFPTWKDSKLTYEDVQEGINPGMKEIPTTRYVLNFLFRKYEFQLDIDSSSLFALKYITKRNSGFYTMLVIHSFSFLLWDEKRKEYIPNYFVIRNYKKYLQFLKRNNFKSIFFDQTESNNSFLNFEPINIPFPASIWVLIHRLITRLIIGACKKALCSKNAKAIKLKCV